MKTVDPELKKKKKEIQHSLLITRDSLSSTHREAVLPRYSRIRPRFEQLLTAFPHNHKRNFDIDRLILRGWNVSESSIERCIEAVPFQRWISWILANFLNRMQSLSTGSFVFGRDLKTFFLVRSLVLFPIFLLEGWPDHEIFEKLSYFSSIVSS